MRLSVRRATMPVMYRERPSRLPGAVVWQSDPATGVRVLPDGCMDLLWNGTDLLVAGPDTTAYVAGPTPYTGLRFAPGTLPALLRVPAHELRDRRVPLTDLWPTSRVRRMADVVAQAAATRGPGQAADLADGDSGSAWPTGTPSALGQAGAALDNLVLDLAGSPDPFVTQLVRRLRAGEPVAAIAADAEVSERQLHRRSLALFGYGPKVLARILRLQRALALARRGTPYATVAVTAGYADQPHLARDVKSLTGVPLTTLLP